MSASSSPGLGTVTWPATEQGLPTTPTDGVLAYDEGLLIGYRWYDGQGREPRYRFGHGLGYTSWDYQHVGAELDQDGTVALQVRLKNTGTRSGRDVVQVYTSRPDSAVPRPRRWLVGFAAASAAAGEELTVPSSYPSAPSSTGTTPGMPGAPNLAHFTCTWALPPATCPAHRHRDPRQLMPGVHLPSYAPGRGRQHPTQKGHGLETRFRTLTTVPLEDPRRDEPPARRTLAVCGRAQPDGRPGQGWSGGFDGPEVFHDD
jgi:hypothetical protein